jgi:hypothetical protein
MINYTVLNISESLLNSGILIAQASESDSGGGFLGTLISLAAYIFGSFCTQKVFQRLNQPNDWLAWIPIANVYASLKAGDQSPWWTVAMFVPFVNIAAIVFLIIAWVNIVKKLGKTPWLLFLMLVPIANFWLMYHLAFQ